MSKSEFIRVNDHGAHRGRQRYTLESTFKYQVPPDLIPRRRAVIRQDEAWCQRRDEFGLPKLSAIKLFVELETTGSLVVHKGYAWDGPSVPWTHPANMMRASLVHDVFYQMLREGVLFDLAEEPARNIAEHERIRKASDRLFQQMCRDDGLKRPVSWAAKHVLYALGVGSAARRTGYGEKNVAILKRFPK